MEELRAHATDWTQNIQNMSMDFRIPNPLEFNDPFLMQRRRWKRSERRRMRRGAQGTLGSWARGGSENGHLPSRWQMLSSSMSRLEAQSSLERGGVPKPRLAVSGVGGGTVPRTGPKLKADRAVDLQVEARSFPHLLARSFSLPVDRSTSKLDSPQERSLSGSESPFDSRSDESSASSSCLVLHRFQTCRAVSNMEERGAPPSISTTQENDRLIPTEDNQTSDPGLLPSYSAPAPPPYSSHPAPTSYHPITTAPSPGCQLLDFFGENLAYIDESSDTLSDRTQPAAREEKRKQPRKPKRRNMRRQLSKNWSPSLGSRPTGDMQPPSNPPTPPPDSLSVSDGSDNQTL